MELSELLYEFCFYEGKQLKLTSQWRMSYDILFSSVKRRQSIEILKYLLIILHTWYCKRDF
ncbi:hypothetical protein T4B_4185 [Trichinella pseudospiralis]|uniref:Uncharacterized protein n=2 Tax=Trichinella pseudospiralis TaxID=6337 RepID=A0A0V1J4R5_TRIPS|nr:hypothetical protein T4E_1421 [Trichinella pseudospiralis]KRY67647.1 hypothetical protein T4A_8898 [Trichinella pseudospiralis]KRY83420.1 hypothetical protein T4D_8418 [Trichinella pseudospiralis]KRZ23832.1 hypothetical protein T4B_4185 [Trichinella pseudospiralis]KRZ29956.1 hypothetical protein T4C_4191 [Trichinella pseudospiralis]